MPSAFTERENDTLVRQAIAQAEAAATSDAEFVQLLRAIYFTQHPVLGSELGDRGRGGRRTRATRGASPGGTRAADPSRHIYDDPRYLQNARALAQRATQRLRIIGGKRVTGTNFADCVAVGNDEEFGCTGTLIAPTVVVSAGHCSRLATRVLFGNDVRRKGRIIDVARAIRHPGYHKAKNHDLLVLILERKATVAPRRIADSASIDAATDGRAVGFGNVDPAGRFGYGIKRQVDVPIASAACSGKVAGERDPMAYGCDAGLEMVAGKPLLAKDSCTGDSGGPFYVSDGRKGWLLAAATSRATKSAMNNCGDGGIYVRLDKYREWIEDSAQVKLR